MYTNIERRQNRRAKTALDQALGDFNLEVNGKTVPIIGSNNISISGMDIRATEALQPDANVKLHFQTRDLHLAVNGQVAWCAENVGEAMCEPINHLYAMGIEFDPASLDDNSLLFLALRQYIDAFE